MTGVQTCALPICTSPKNIRGEIIEGDREWIMDFRVRPVAKFKIAEDGHFVEDN